MYYRKLGNTGYLTGEIGFAAWPNAAQPAPADDTAAALLRLALDRGVSFIEVSARDDGRMEQLVGRGIAGRRENVAIAARVEFSGLHTIEEQARASLERLRCDYIDLLLLHRPAFEDLERPKTWTSIARLQDAGLVRHIGVIADSEVAAVAALEDDRVSAVEIVLNALDTELLPLLARARTEGAGVIVSSPLHGGLLAVDNAAGRAYTAGDPRHAWPKERLQRAAELATRFGRIVADSGSTRAQLAIGWVLAHEEVSVVLPVATTEQQLIENLAASDLPLPSPRQLAALQHARLTAALV
ncbi:MAG: aldo/keto reductase [Dehalococcoidia bacterium]